MKSAMPTSSSISRIRTRSMVGPRPALADIAQAQGERGARAHGALGVLAQLGPDLAVDDRIAPVVEPDALGQQLGAQTVAGTRDRVDHDLDAPHGAPRRTHATAASAPGRTSGAGPA